MWEKAVKPGASFQKGEPSALNELMVCMASHGGEEAVRCYAKVPVFCGAVGNSGHGVSCSDAEAKAR